MKKVLLFAFVIVLGFVFVSAADDLADAAKKEKARREEIAKKKKETKTYTNEDIKNLKSSLGMEQGSDDETQTDTTGDDTTAESTDNSAPDTTEIDLQIKQLQDEREEQQKKADEARTAINQGGVYHTYNANQQYEAERTALARIAEIDKKIAELNAQKTKGSQPKENKDQKTESEQPPFDETQPEDENPQ